MAPMGLFMAAKACYRPPPTQKRATSRRTAQSSPGELHPDSQPRYFPGHAELAMAVSSKDIAAEAYTFDDVLLKPGLSEILPSDVDIRSRITRTIPLNIPIVASAMDTVTQAPLAIGM